MLSDLYVTRIGIDPDVACEPYVEALPVVRHLRGEGPLELSQRVTILVGENGVGKSTLVEALAVNLGFNPEGGSRNFSFSTAATHSRLHDALKVTKGYRGIHDGFFLRAESFYNAASYLDSLEGALGSYGGVSLHEQSHGEGFMALAENRLGGHGIYILDEPEAALSPMSVMRLMCTINSLAKDGSQFVIATHSPMLMALPGAEVLELTEAGVESVDYRQTEHFAIMREFLNAPERMCALLFD